MTKLDRRQLISLAGAGAAAASLPASIQRALAIEPHRRTGTIQDVEHIVVLTQENRSFDQYYGALRGVRGFGDPRPAFLPGKKSVWRQPDGKGGEVAPFRPSGDNPGMQFIEDVGHGWNDTHACWNNGVNDKWAAVHSPTAMIAFTRQDIPYHYALADAFTVCDAYFCSVMGPTDPNRYYMWTGYTGNDGPGVGSSYGPVLNNAEAGYDWMTYPERLVAAGISSRVYQDVGDGLDAAGFWGWTGDPYIGNYGDNSLLYFHQYQNALPGNPLYDIARQGTNIKNGGTLFDMLRADVAANRLPQVSWIAAPESYSEHPNFPPNYGAWYIDQVLDALTSNPEVWSKTVLLLNFDEAGGFFDHVQAPVAVDVNGQGKSTVATTNEYYPGGGGFNAGPYGLGTRAPLTVISPWSRGGYVNSQVFDHTSIIQFIEKRFAGGNAALMEKNISPWRRAVCGDLTSCFDFRPANRAVPTLPATDGYAPPDRLRHDDVVPTPPATRHIPRQEDGVRPKRALPYAFDVVGGVTNDGFALLFGNYGQAGAHFQLRDGSFASGPRNYTVEAGKALADTVAIVGGYYDLSVYGPNGFVRRYKGPSNAGVEATLRHGGVGDRLVLDLVNKGVAAVQLTIIDRYSDDRRYVTLRSGHARHIEYHAERSLRWYDLIVTDNAGGGFRRQFAGYLENGRDGFSDPLIAVYPPMLVDNL